MGGGGVTLAPSQHLTESVFSPRKPLMMRNGEGKCDKGRNSDEKTRARELERRKKCDADRGELQKGEIELGKLSRKGDADSRSTRGEVERGEFVSDGKWKRGTKWELGKGEVFPEKSKKGDLEKGELSWDRGGRWELDTRGDRVRRQELEKGELAPEKSRKGDGSKWDEEKNGNEGDNLPGRGWKLELEKGDSIIGNGYRCKGGERLDFGSDRGRKLQHEGGKFVPENWRRDGSWREVYTMRKSSSNWDTKKSSRAPNEEPGDFRYESNGKSRDKDYPESWSKRHCTELEVTARKYQQDFIENSWSKSWKKLEEDNPARAHPISSSKLSSSSSSLSRYPSASRHHEPALQSRVSHGKRSHHDPRDYPLTDSERSSIERANHYDHRDRNPTHSDRSSCERARQDYRDQTPTHFDRSSLERARHHNYKEWTSTYFDRAPLERARNHDHREGSPLDGRRGTNHQDGNKKSGGGEKQLINRYEERRGRRQYGGEDTTEHSSVKQVNNSTSTTFGRSDSTDKCSKRKDLLDSVKESSELPPPRPLPPPPPALPPSPPRQAESNPPHQPKSNGELDELPSMEEDMDICDTPLHETIPTDAKLGKWFYLDHFGIEQGPSKLDDLKRLVEEGFILSDQLIKHADNDRWVTVENAASPLLQLNFSSIVSDAVTEMVSPPEASGNSLNDSGDAILGRSSPLLQQECGHVEEMGSVVCVEDFCIDERVEALLDGYDVVDGKELETIEEALNTTFEHADWENWDYSEGFMRFQACSLEAITYPIEEGIARAQEGFSREATETRPVLVVKEVAITAGGSSDWFAGRWSCKGGDWKRNDESVYDRSLKKKVVLNHGYPLCQMPKCGHEDPRWRQMDDLYFPSRNRKLELPSWAFSLSEDYKDSSSEMSKGNPLKQRRPPIPRGVKGTILPVVRINAYAVRGHGSSDTHLKVKGERHGHWFTRLNSERSLSYEGSSHSKKPSELYLQSLHKCRTALSVPRDHVCTIDELVLNLGDWYYLDGAGHEHGPSSYSELQDLAAKGTIMQKSSVFRKVDNIWLPVNDSETAHNIVKEMVVDSATDSAAAANMGYASRSFHDSHPQFVGYMRGKLHELVMKSYKNREFAAVINEVLDPWISAKQAEREMDKHFPFNSSITKSSIHGNDLSGDKLCGSDDSIPESYRGSHRYGKRVRLLFEDGDFELEEDLLLDQKNDPSFDELFGETIFVDESDTSYEAEKGSWGLLNNHILARVFHFIRTDMKSLLSSAATCRHWHMGAKFYKKLCVQVDLSSTGRSCTDSMLRSVLSDYDKQKLTSLILAGCSSISAGVLEEMLQLFPCVSSINIRGCSQFKDLTYKFQNVKWVNSYSFKNRNNDESYSKIKSLKQITDKGYEFSLVDKKDSSSHPFRQGVYKRAKLFDARKSAAVMSRDAQMRHWRQRKSGNSEYRKVEGFIANNLNDIMKENKFDFFIPKVAQIEDRMRSGYYIRHGLGSMKDDISRMCRDAFKAKNRGDAKEMKPIIMLFIRLAKSLEGNLRLKYERDDMAKTHKNSLTPRYKRKQNKVLEKKGVNKFNNTSYVNGGADAFDREIKRSLSKLKKRDDDSDSETSDDHENDFSGDDRGDGETTASDTESDLDIHSGSESGDAKGNMYSMVVDSIGSVTDDREWGARMTKASLVPPVTRKYEVIDKYLVIADQEEVKRKMQVALPDDYSEKLLAQKSGIEESDMEIPEVKEHKRRKLLGVEVLEQEVYGIDPYTHNLLLNSMPEESEWFLVDKHKFIEEELLRPLNKQAREFSGTGNTPMVYPLRLVIEEIQRNAEDHGDRRILKLCQAMLKAMQSRPDDNYVAYRKGLGVVCNKEGGFHADDFVVEFLGEVYPAWKWFEKQDGIKSLQKNSQDPAPEFYNIYLERPKGDHDGYDLVVVDAMHKANYASRICHSCRPNCEAKVMAVDGQYQIGIYTVRPIGYGEEITFDYNSVTESKEEYEASVCLCGSQICRGSYLNLTGEDAFHKVLKEWHGVLDRHKLMLQACEANFVSEEDYVELGKAGLGTCLLSGLPDWLVSYSAHLVRFINFERTKLPDAILKHNVEEKRKFFVDVCLEDERSDAEVQAEGVYNSRLQNMALTLDKVRYVMRFVFGDPKKAPPPLEKLSSEDLVYALWRGQGSLIEELLQFMTPHMESDLLNDLKSKIHSHNLSDSSNIQGELRKSLLWLRDELRNLPCTSKCRHDAAADLIHLYAYTKCFYKVREYKTVISPPVKISPLDLGPKYAEKMASGFQEYCKTYGENYCLGQLIYWHSQNNADPDCRLAKASRGCLSLPDVSSFYGKSHKPVQERVYDSRTVRFMMSRMEQPQRSWPKDRIWVFKCNQRILGSPMLDSVLNKCPLDNEMMQWLKSRPSVYQSSWDGS